MKTVFSLIILACVVIGCGSKNDKDSLTGMTVENDGLRIGKATLMNGQDQVTTSNVVSMGETVAIVVDEVEGYELQEGRAFPTLDVVVTDKEGEIVLERKNMFANKEGYLPADASVLRGTVTVGAPMRSGETYHATMSVWDSIKPENTVVVKVDLVVK